MNTSRPALDKYFEKLGINVFYNTLGHNNELITSFVSDYKDVLKTYAATSNHIKHTLYNQIYNLEFRHKKTGFEQISNLDKDFRNKISKIVKKSQFSQTCIVDKEQEKSYKNYKEHLSNLLTKIDNPILYYSGGLDSELVARSLLDNHKKFTVVIVEWLNEGKIINDYELAYAYKFCRDHSIIPIIKQIDVKQLWNSDEFFQLASNLDIISPQLVSHAYIVLLINQQFPNRTHLFGGEVRFKNYFLDDGEMAKLIFLDKLAPGYDGQTYTSNSDGTCSAAQLDLVYSASAGTYEILYSFPPGFPPTYLSSGTWTDTPSSSYEYRISSLTTWPTIGSNSGTPTPSSAPTGWSAISGNKTICSMNQYAAGSPVPPTFYDSDAIFGIEVRVVGQTSPVQSSTVRFNTLSSCY